MPWLHLLTGSGGMTDLIAESLIAGNKDKRKLIDAMAENKRLLAGYKKILVASDYEMCDGDLARDIASAMLQ